ncbi:MAG: hypothetical protein BJ554DRAFT_6598 [Olpidium bornovanus]|uniref:Uncharacterized protein n=1 Tax=Olpidium bornovanus TaxID=278681 RepID=A0A8H7ZYB9_9FUNG|nr:MAG: hypothetical protein BJ554DRAFT_6598 [Olpidium bornovanus]
MGVTGDAPTTLRARRAASRSPAAWARSCRSCSRNCANTRCRSASSWRNPSAAAASMAACRSRSFQVSSSASRRAAAAISTSRWITASLL